MIFLFKKFEGFTVLRPLKQEIFKHFSIKSIIFRSFLNHRDNSCVNLNHE